MTRTLALALAAGVLAAGTGMARDLSILHFSDGIWAVAPARAGLHRVRVPGGAVHRSEVVGDMSRVDTEEGVNLIASVPMGVAGREIHLDMGTIQEVVMAHRITLVTAETGTALYFPGQDRLVGMRISDGYPKSVMAYGDIVATLWGNEVALFGMTQGRIYRFVFPMGAMKDLHLGENTVMSIWPEDGTYLHTLGARGWTTTLMSYEIPGDLSARSGMSGWKPITGSQSKPGTLFSQPQVFSGPTFF